MTETTMSIQRCVFGGEFEQLQRVLSDKGCDFDTEVGIRQESAGFGY